MKLTLELEIRKKNNAEKQDQIINNEKFYNQWLAYYEQLNKEGIKGVSQNLDENKQKLLNNDQK